MLQSSGGGRLLELVAASPHTAAVLVAAGLLDQLMQAVRASPVNSSGQLGRNNILQQLLRAAEDVAQQPAAAAGSEADAAAAVAEAAADRSALNAESIERHCLLPARRLAAALLAWWRRPAAQQAAVLESARAAAARSCAYLRCTNLGGEGGPAAGQGTGSKCCRWDAGRLQGSQHGWKMLLWLPQVSALLLAGRALFFPLALLHLPLHPVCTASNTLLSPPAPTPMQRLPRCVVLRHRLLAR